MKSLNVSRQVIDFLERHPSRSFKTKELARSLLLPKQGEGYQLLKEALRELLESGRIERIEGRKWRIHLDGELHDGTLRISSQGWGFVTLEAQPERVVRIPKRRLFDAADGDRVRVRIVSSASPEREEGEIVEFLGAGVRETVGTVKMFRGHWYVEPGPKSQMRDIVVMKRDLGGARDGDKVVVELQSAPGGEPSGAIVEILGRRGESRTELAALARQFGLSLHFPAEVDNEAMSISPSIPDDELARRMDLRDQVTFTIDPEDAKDFDDAVSITTDEEGNHVLGVHIADVSHFVRRETPLDREAYKRGTSVYLVDGVIPMLPERLSNHLCSLQEGKDRLTYSVFMTVSPRGAVKSFSIRKSVIRSRRRFSYEEAQRVIDDGKGDFAEELGQLNALAMMLTRKRFREGSIDFNLPEVKFVFAPSGQVLDIVAKPRLQSMRLIEECMLLANRTVAGAIRSAGVRETQLPFLYRVHDLPDPDKVRELVEFIRHLGLDVRLDATSSKSFQRMIEALNGKEEAAVVQDVTIRSMAKAVYSEKNIGHFGLGFSLYTHFTSPIRRYPDLVVHRLLHEYQSGRAEGVRRGYERRIADIARHSSERERLAVEAERESVKIMQVEYMKRHLGDSFDAIVSGVTSYGLYVEIIPTLVEGLVHIRSMSDDFYDFDARKKTLIGRRRGRRFRLGDALRVQVARVDPLERRIDFILTET